MALLISLGIQIVYILLVALYLLYVYLYIVKPYIRNKIVNKKHILISIILGLVGAIGLSYEQSGRVVQEIEYTPAKKSEGPSRPIRPADSETLQEKSKRLLEESEENNKKSKESFDRL